MNKRSPARNKWALFKENNSTAHVCFLIISANVVFILCASVLISLLPENKGRTIPEIIRLAFTLMVNPSGKYVYSEAPVSLIITTIVVMMGMISLTGGTVGFITSVINAFIDKTAHSKRMLKLANHIVVMNFNRRVPAILCDYCFDDEDSTYVVILTDQDRDTVNHQIDEMYKQVGRKKPFKHVIVRTGSPMSSVDLDRISLADAQTVLITAPGNLDSADTGDSGYAVSKQFLFITGYLKAQKPAHDIEVIVETRGDNMEEMIRSYPAAADRLHVTTVDYNKLIGKMLGVTAIMPMANEVLRQLFSFQGVELYTRAIPDASIEQELSTSNSVIPLFDSDGCRVYIAEDESEFGIRRSAPFVLSKPLPDHAIQPDISFRKSAIVIIGSNAKLPYILESLACFKQEYHNSGMHVVLADTADRLDRLQQYYSDPAFSDILESSGRAPIAIRNIYRPMDDLRNEPADVFLFLSDDEVAPAHIDEKPVLYWSNIHRDIGNGNAPDIIVELCDLENQSIISSHNDDQILVSDDFLGRLYAQLGKNPRRKEIIMDLITTDGDTASVNGAEELVNTGDLICLSVAQFFNGVKCDLTFTSKRELILWVYRATAGKALPIGVAKQHVAYLFSRTEAAGDSLDSCALLGIEDGQRYISDKPGLTLEPDDQLIFFNFS